MGGKPNIKTEDAVTHSAPYHKTLKEIYSPLGFRLKIVVRVRSSCKWTLLTTSIV